MPFLSKTLINFLSRTLLRIVFLVFLCVVLIGVVIIMWRMTKLVDLSAVNYMYEIAPGTTPSQLADDLAQKKIISDPWLFNLYIKMKKLDTKLQAGRYDFSQTSALTLTDLIELLSKAAKPHEATVIIPEGFTYTQIGKVLEDKNIVTQAAFIESAEGGYLLRSEISDFVNPQNRYFSFLDSKIRIPSDTGVEVHEEPTASHLEGYLFPDTYRIYEKTTADEIIELMLYNFDKKLTLDLREEIAAQGKTLDEVVIMASIIEREVQTPEDMRMVSDILWRRLEAGYRLEVDSTLNYILPEHERKAALTDNELSLNSPYNTYKSAGLPPTAISNPGFNALYAAVHPIPNDYWYYLSKSTGETVFAKTYEEHLHNKASYLE